MLTQLKYYTGTIQSCHHRQDLTPRDAKGVSAAGSIKASCQDIRARICHDLPCVRSGPIGKMVHGFSRDIPAVIGWLITDVFHLRGNVFSTTPSETTDFRHFEWLAYGNCLEKQLHISRENARGC